MSDVKRFYRRFPDSFLAGAELRHVLKNFKDIEGKCICGQHEPYLVECPTVDEDLMFESLSAANDWAKHYKYAFDWLSLAVLDTLSTEPYEAPWGDGNSDLSPEHRGFTVPKAILEIHVFDDTIIILVGHEDFLRCYLGPNFDKYNTTLERPWDLGNS